MKKTQQLTKLLNLTNEEDSDGDEFNEGYLQALENVEDFLKSIAKDTQRLSTEDFIEKVQTQIDKLADEVASSYD